MRYILLNEGDVICRDDELLRSVARDWVVVGPSIGNKVGSGVVVRRKVDADLEPLLETLFKLQEERVASERMAT